MTQSQQAKYSCYYDPHHHHHHHRHHRKHHSPKDSTDEPAKVKGAKAKPEEKPGVKKPGEKPWSEWIAADNGRYFYRARRNSADQWEYGFMEPPGSQQQGVQERMPFTGPPISVPAGSSAATFSGYPPDPAYPVIHGVDPSTTIQQSAPPAKVGPLAIKAADIKAKGKAKTHEAEHKGWNPDKSADKKSKKKHHQSKKLGTVVSAERGKKFNHQSIVQGWLDDYESEPPGE